MNEERDVVSEDTPMFDPDEIEDGEFEHNGMLFCGCCGMLAQPGDEEYDWCDHKTGRGCCYAPQTELDDEMNDEYDTFQALHENNHCPKCGCPVLEYLGVDDGAGDFGDEIADMYCCVECGEVFERNGISISEEEGESDDEQF